MGKGIKMPSISNIVKAAVNPIGSVVSQVTGNKALGNIASGGMGTLGGAAAGYIDPNSHGAGGGYSAMTDASGMPIAPEFQSMIDPKTGMLNSKYSNANNFKATDLDTSAMNKFKSDAMRDAGTQSAWAKAVSGLNDQKRANELDRVSSNQRAQTMGAYDDLAASGGVNSGSRERIARGGVRDLLNSTQGVNNSYNQTANNLSAQDEQNRVNQLGQYNSMLFDKARFDQTNDANSYQAKQADINNALAEVNRGRDAAWKTYSDKMAAYGANKTADAQVQASKSGGKK